MEFSKRLVQTGIWKGHVDYEPSIWALGNGERCNLVAKITMIDHETSGGHWCQGIVTGQRFRLVADLPLTTGCTKVTLLNVAKTFFRWPMLVVDHKAEILVHPQEDQSKMTKLVETCAGLGGIACGASYAGWKLQVQNDLNPNFVKIQSQVASTPVIEGDIGHMPTIAALHRACPSAGTLAFGFACQPYSSAGDKREGQDPRSQSLPSSLYAAHLLQKDIVVCECVPGAATSKFVLSCLDYHMEMTGSDRSEVLLELADLWPSKRRRWWTVIVKQYIGKVSLRPMPKLTIDPTVSCLLPQFMQLPDHEFQSLVLTHEERRGFEAYGKGIGSQVVDKNKVLQTALHSWGNQLISCSCGCRGPFSHERLKKNGLFGALVHVAGMPPDRNLRHISPKEVALLTGFPRREGWDHDARLLLAGMGQVASPLQAAWIFALIRNHLVDSKIIPGPQASPLEVITCVTSDLFDLRDQWAPQSTSVTTQLFQEQFDEWILAKDQQAGSAQTDPLASDEMTHSQEEALIRHVKDIEKTVDVACTHPDTPDVSPQECAAACEGKDHVMPDASKDASIVDAQGISKDDMPQSPVTYPAAKCEQSSSPTVHETVGKPPGSIQPGVGQPPQHSPKTPHHVAQQAATSCPSPEDVAQSFPCTDKHPMVPERMSVDHVSPSNASNAPDSFTAHFCNVRPSNAQSMWEASGAISAFATAPHRTVSPEVPLSSQAPLADTHVAQQYLHPQLCSKPQDLVEQGVLVYDADLHIISHVKCSPEVTFAQWCHANEQIGVSCQTCVDLFGIPIHQDTYVIQLKWIVVVPESSITQFHLATRMAQLSQLPRIESALLQGPSVASDEMMFYLSAIASVGLAKVKPPFILDGMTDLLVDAQAWVAGLDQVNFHNAKQLELLAQQWIQIQPVQEATISAIWVNYHWIPVWLVPTQDHLIVHTTYEGAKVWEMLFPWWQTIVHVHDDLPQVFEQDCGFRTFAWLVSQCTQTPLAPLSQAEARGWRHLFWQTLVTHPRKQRRFVLGGQSEMEIALQAILREHGVFASRITERASMLIRSLPAPALGAVFQATRPWQALKQLASNHKPPIRLVLEDELQTAIKSRAKDRKSVQAKSKAPAHTGSSQYVHPDDIVIPHGIFCLQSGEPVAQISPQQLGQNVHGIVAFTEQEVQPYLQHGPVATVGIGFLVLSPYTEALAQQGQIVRFPVQSKLSAEPMLVSAVLLQRGTIHIVRNTPSHPHAVEQVPTQTIKCLLYRDQLNDQWQSVVAAPVKFIIGMTECLQICKVADCQCAKWHSNFHKADTPILDVWQRDFLSIHFQKCRPNDAQLYAVAMRVTSEVFATLFKQSGTAGLYVEPRSDDGRGQDPRYHTIWIPRQPINEVKALQSMQNTSVSIIRVGYRYGFKVPVEAAEQVHAQINPHEPYIAGASKMTYRVGPFPWGTTKKAIQALFQQWQWQARPIHTIAKAMDSSGLMWLVHAAKPPASLVFQLQHGDVVVHQESSSPKDPWRPPPAQVAKGDFQDKRESDFDPWAEAARHLPRKDGVSQAQIANIEANLEHKLSKRFQVNEEADVAMSSSLEPRVVQLEQQLAELQARSGVIENKVDYVHKQVEQQSSKFEAALDSKLSEQMLRIEALITKRARSHE